MKKFKRWLIKKLGGVPIDEICATSFKYETSEVELVRIDAIRETNKILDIPLGIIEIELKQELFKKINLDIRVEHNPILDTNTYRTEIEIPRKYIKKRGSEE